MRVPLFDWVPALEHHPLDELIELRECLLGRVHDERRERLPLALPFVPVHSRLPHGKKMPLSETVKLVAQRERDLPE